MGGSKGVRTPLSPASSDMKYQTMQFFNTSSGKNNNLDVMLIPPQPAVAGTLIQATTAAFRAQRNKSVVNRADTAASVVETLASLNVQAKQT